MNPDLIPQPGILFHLTPANAPDEFWVNMDTRGCGYVIGRVMLRRDGTWRVYMNPGQEPRGDAKDAECAIWLCVRAWLNGPESPAAAADPCTCGYANGRADR
jgi:hypothetical protein